MSLILDALNRSRDDARQVPGLATSHYGESRPPAGRLQRWLLFGALLLAAAVIAWLLWERSATRPVETATATAPLSTPVAPAGPAAKPENAGGQPAAAIAAQEMPAAPAPARRQAELELATAEPVSPRPVDTAEAVPTPAQAGTASASVEALYRQQQLAPEEIPAAPPAPAAQAPDAVAPASRAREEEPVDIEQLLSTAEQELQNARLAEHPAPFLTELSQRTKDSIPTLMYQSHDYAGNQADSVVLINGKALRAGGSTAGVRVEEILPDSVVLSFQGTQFRLRALNSWVNL